MIYKLTGEKKAQQIKWLRRMDRNLLHKHTGWEKENQQLSDKIEQLFKDVGSQPASN